MSPPPPQVTSLNECQQQQSCFPNDNLHGVAQPQQEAHVSSLQSGPPPRPMWVEINEGGGMWSWFQNLDTSTLGSQFSHLEDLLSMDY